MKRGQIYIDQVITHSRLRSFLSVVANASDSISLLVMRDRCGLSINPLCGKMRSTGAELDDEHNVRSNYCENKQNSSY